MPAVVSSRRHIHPPAATPATRPDAPERKAVYRSLADLGAAIDEP
mgnify:CR=1 FL=1